MEDGMLLRIYMAESARIHAVPGYKYLTDFFLKRNFPGLTVTRGMTGFGHEKLIRTVDVLHLSLDLPIVIDVVDTRERIMEVLPEVEAMVEHGLVTVQDVQMTRKVPGKESS
jgi:PII-like signaling protein